VGAALALTATGLSLAAPGRGHALERPLTGPFTSAGNAVARSMLGQWVTVPGFVLAGGWRRALRESARGAAQ